jgi:hypothetical protein
MLNFPVIQYLRSNIPHAKIARASSQGLIFFMKEEGRRKKEEGRRKKEEGRRKKEEGRRKTEDGRRKKEDGRRKTEDGRRKKAFRLRSRSKEDRKKNEEEKSSYPDIRDFRVVNQVNYKSRISNDIVCTSGLIY